MDENTNRIESFDQSELLNGSKNPASAGGACHMFALKWLSEIIDDKSLGTSVRIQNLKKYASEVKMLYKAFGDRWNREGGRFADSGTAKMLGVEVYNFTQPISLDQVASDIQKEHRVGFVYSFWFSKGGAHSIGIYRSGATWGGHIYVFEPNFGEYKMEKSQLSSWFKQFLAVKYAAFGKINSHQLRYVRKYNSPVVKGGVKIM